MGLPPHQSILNPSPLGYDPPLGENRNAGRPSIPFASVAATAAFTFFALAFPNVTRTFTIPGAIACFILTVYFIWPEIRDFHESRRKRVIALVGMIICAICFAGFAAFYFWPDKTEAVAEASALDGSLQISCENSAYPTVVPPNRMCELQLTNRFTNDDGTFIWWTFPAGTTLPPRDQATSPIDGQRCRISNYGKMAIIHAQVTFPVDSERSRRWKTGPDRELSKKQRP